MYQDRADAENNSDELKNQGWFYHARFGPLPMGGPNGGLGL
jgi:hypothetical protein